ncbi:MAG: glutathione S-transferase family protein [Gammaproteobacteria bacterium]|nr:glutathione S-transferase family protein [Gammaproteobacteria bacterium]
MPMFTLIIGNKNYSSWSLRAWLLMRVKGIPFDEIRIPMYVEGSRAAIQSHSPSGKVPALRHGGTVVWDSLAICEYLAEQYPDAGCWPADQAARAEARAVSAEMHSGFQALREALPMNCRRRVKGRPVPPPVQADIDRVCSIWRSCREGFGAGGQFLFGDFSIADAMYAPVALRFQTYDVIPRGIESAYMEAVLALSALQDWLADASIETEVIAEYEEQT